MENIRVIYKYGDYTDTKVNSLTENEIFDYYKQNTGVSHVVIENRLNFWAKFYLNEKYLLLSKLGQSRSDIIKKYQSDFDEYEKHREAWLCSSDRKSFLDGQSGLERAINILKYFEEV